MNFIKNALSFLLSPIHYLVFGLILVVFHPIQWLAYNIGGYPAHKKVVDCLNYSLILSLRILCIRIQFNNPYPLPLDRPLIIVSNHQSMYDISPLEWYLRAHHVKFVSKMELGKGIPSVSYNLRHGGSVLIDRKDSKQALSAIRDFGKYLTTHHYSAVIFPEGTRSRNGFPRSFSRNGLKILMKYTPTALIVPITINNAWKIQKNGYFRVPLGIRVTFDVHEPFPVDAASFDEIFERLEKTIKSAILLPQKK